MAPLYTRNAAGRYGGRCGTHVGISRRSPFPCSATWREDSGSCAPKQASVRCTRLRRDPHAVPAREVPFRTAWSMSRHCLHSSRFQRAASSAASLPWLHRDEAAEARTKARGAHARSFPLATPGLATRVWRGGFRHPGTLLRTRYKGVCR